MDHDRLIKELITTFFDEFVAFAAPALARYLEPGSAVFLNKEMFTDVTEGTKLEADIVVKARLRETEEAEAFFLIHVENQASAQRDFPKRMFRYFARLHENHNLPVYPIAVFTYGHPRVKAPNEYHVAVRDLPVMDFRFKTVQLNRLNWRDYVNSDNPVATALMSQMNVAPKDRPKVKLECLRAFVKQGWDPARLQLLFGYADSYLKLDADQRRTFEDDLDAVGLSEKEEVMEIVTSWEQAGIDKGLIQGLKQGRQEGAVEVVLKQLRRRVSTLSEDREARVRQLPMERLDALSEALLDFGSVEDLDAWLAA